VASFSPGKEKDGQSKERKKEEWCPLLRVGLQSMLMLLGVKGRHVLLVWQETIEVKF